MEIESRHLFPDAPTPPPDHKQLSFQEATRQFQARLLQDRLNETGWNVVETARSLDLARSHIYNKIRAFGLERGK
jgi:DNA-binding NtrC family response regulator